MFIMKTEGFKYYAFISYSHKDQKLAKRLQRHLQSYHLPSSILKTNPELPKRLTPVFMDESNLVASGTLKSALRDNLDASNYLIVICSPNSGKSEYVNDEVEYFIETGRADHIIPFIIEGIPHSSEESKECFPRAILNLPREHELLGIDMQKFGVRDSFSRLIATLLSLDLDHFVDYEKRRRRRKIAAIALAAAAFMIAAGIFVWHNIIPHYNYYHAYVYKWEKPVGLFEVKDEAERKKKEYTYKFTSVGGEVKMIERVNSAGILIDPVIITPFTELPMIKFVSDRTVEYYDVNGKKVYRKEYTKNFEAVDFYRGDDDLPYAIQPETSNYRINKYDFELGHEQNNGNIIRMTLDYDNNGYVIRKMFRLNNHGGDDKKGVIVEDKNGRGGLSYKIDEIGRVTEVHYLDTDRDVMTVGGISVERIEYGRPPYPVKVSYVDDNDDFVQNSQGVSIAAIDYDKNFNTVKLSYLGTKGENVSNKDYGISEVVLSYDTDNGFLISERFYDDNLVPCTYNKDYSRIEFMRNEEGRISDFVSYNAKGEKIIRSGDIAIHSAEEAYDLGREYYFQREYEQAIAFYLIAADQGYVKAQDALGHVYEWGKQDYEQALYWYKKAAEQGYAEAQDNLAGMYSSGHGVKQDYEQALYWHKKAAEQGYDGAQYSLGFMYRYGYGVKQDYEQAVLWYRKAAEQGNKLALENLGDMYRYGYGVEQDYEQAIELYQKAAEDFVLPSESAQLKLGSMYQNGEGVKQSYRQAVKWYRKAAEHGDSEAQKRLGDMYSYGEGVKQDYEQAIEWYKKAADKRYTPAQNRLGYMYSNGEGVEQDHKQAVEWYRKAADMGNASAQNNLGYAYQNGEGVEQDYEQAIIWYEKSANQGNEAAQYNLGYMYQNGEGVEKDYERAFAWYEKSAEQGNANAQYMLGYMYDLGLGVEEDNEQAVAWYEKAADQGDVDAQGELGEMYFLGLGIEQNYEKAVKWYEKAAEQGDAHSSYNLGLIHEFHRDPERAIIWYKKAAEQGELEGLFNIGSMYGWGRIVKQDYEQAIVWYEKAAELGLSKAQYSLGLAYENEDWAGHNLQTAYMWYYLACLFEVEDIEDAEDKLENLSDHLSEDQINEAKYQAEKKFNEIKEKNQ